jgi:hypothetical protein
VAKRKKSRRKGSASGGGLSKKIRRRLAALERENKALRKAAKRGKKKPRKSKKKKRYSERVKLVHRVNIEEGFDDGRSLESVAEALRDFDEGVGNGEIDWDDLPDEIEEDIDEEETDFYDETPS